MDVYYKKIKLKIINNKLRQRLYYNNVKMAH